MTPLRCPVEPAIDLAPGTLGDACSPAVVRPCSEQRHMCDRRSCSDADLPVPNHLVKVQKGIRWLVYFGEVLSLVRLTGRLIKYS